VVEVRPEIALGDLDGMAVRRRAVAVAEEEIDGVLERLRESRATYEKVDRAAETDDQILLDLVPADDAGGFPADAKIPDQRFVLGSAGNMPEFNEQLAGCAAGDVKVVAVQYPADHPNEKLRGRSLDFECRVREVAAKTVPGLDDAFAATLEEGKTLEDLRSEIRRDLEKEAARRVDQELDRQVREELVRRHDVVPPPSMVERYLASGLEEMARRNQQMGRELTEDDRREYLEGGRPHAEEALKAMLLMEAVRAQEEIKVTPEDVDERIGEIAAENGFDVDRYREFVKSGEDVQRIEYDLLERRTYDFLLSRAEITEVDADTDVFAD
jgi:trigger factor